MKIQVNVEFAVGFAFGVLATLVIEVLRAGI